MTQLDQETRVAVQQPETQHGEHLTKLIETAHIVQNWLEQDLIQPEVRYLALDFIHAVNASERA